MKTPPHKYDGLNASNIRNISLIKQPINAVKGVLHVFINGESFCAICSTHDVISDFNQVKKILKFKLRLQLSINDWKAAKWIQ